MNRLAVFGGGISWIVSVLQVSSVGREGAIHKKRLIAEHFP